MTNFWLRIKVWLKVTLVVALFVYVLLFTFKNASVHAPFWYWFNRQPDTTLLMLVLCSFLAGVVTTFLLRTTFRTIRQMQELGERSRAQRLDRELTDIRTKAAMLQTKPSGQKSSSEPPMSDNDL